MTKQLGPTFSDEVIAAGLGGLPFAWGDTDNSITGRENLSDEQNTTLNGVIEAHDPAKKRPNIISTTEFIARWTNQEYIKLMQDRSTELAASRIGHAKNWDVVIADDTVDLSKTKCINLKADLISDGILTAERANEIFDTPSQEI